MQKIIAIDDPACLISVFGPQDKNIRFLEHELGVSVAMSSGGLLLKGNKDPLERAAKVIEKMIELAKEGVDLSEAELIQYLNSCSLSKGDFSSEAMVTDEHLGIRVPSVRRRLVFPKTEGQASYIQAMRDFDIVFATGPAGTGKTYLAMAMAVNFLLEKKVRRIILARPAIEAGESLGFLPGDMHEKLGPYLRPLYDALYDMMEVEVIEEYLETGIIEIAPLAYMRGRTLNNAFVILDEAQNCTSEQLRMFLTRLGFDSKTVVTGDITQSDLPEGKPAGLLEALHLLEPIEGIKRVSLGKKDVVRHPLIQKIIQAYETFYSQKRN